ncbi:hypothetical protein BT93_L0782 [Corymbia citriodora subsp. variegata]|uniref:Peptidase A1 domain-containing protein n=1 Tax=Corymbia citriodora subsp. variegata TaxID=360336 RepID=A0A8T0CGC2_CORYI|nr:hypothetical protein BT93_L0782 [Corymbia citriodora subsp. variegata]
MQIPNENFNISYADLEYLNGIVGYETVTLAGIEVAHQEVALAQLAGWSGDNITSGLVGLAYPSITSAYAGTVALADNFSDPSSHLVYSPIINTIFFVENLTDSVFSLTLSRNPDPDYGFGGYITIGGIPDITDPTVNASSKFVQTPILQVPFLGDAAAYAFYAIDVDALVYGKYKEADAEGATLYIVDSGTTLNYFTTEDAKEFNALFNPPAENIEGLYFVECTAVPPNLGVTIAGETFYHNPIDLIFDEGIGNNTCISGVQDGGALGAGFFILGDVFQKNVLSVFDVGNEMMAFSAREYYDVPGY